ncbi:MAG TPA: DUF1501 domain-containing protein [Urbifossiella sp.]|jgi:hypothetical protein|nr:DUF1501 domain-containing protein [Urbifossiella sp.]
MLSRRDALARCGTGIGTLALAGVLADDAAGQTPLAPPPRPVTDPLAPRSPHFPGKAKRLVHLFMNGGPSHVDTFDPKPALDRYHGQAIPSGNLRTERKTGAAMKSPFAFAPRGRSGLPISELFAQTAAHADDLCVIRSMHADVPNHEPSLLLMNTGDGRQPRPSVGSWVTYGLGSENRNLPGFVVMCPGGYPIVTTHNWRSSFLPGVYQGTYLDTRTTDADKLIAHLRNPELGPDRQRDQLDLVAALNARHAAERPADPRLEARIRTFELAYRMQAEAADAFDLSRETKETRNLYGDTTHGKQLLLTRRLLERGVRVVQVWSGAGQPWDNHDNLAANHKTLAGQWDKPIAAFLTDLKRRGLFGDTLVLWGGEFGRTPVAELPALNGRDHNHYGFTCWLVGGGVKGGTAYGSTDEFGFQAAENSVHVHDLHATLLHLLGFDHERLTYRYAGRDFRLTDVHGRVVKEILA